MLLVLRLDHLTSNTPIARSSAGGITIMPSFRKAPAPTVWAFTAQRRKPQDGGERAGERKARPKVDTDQDSACDPLGHVSVLHCGAREKTGQQVIDQRVAIVHSLSLSRRHRGCDRGKRGRSCNTRDEDC